MIPFVSQAIIGHCVDTMRDLIAQGVKVQICVTSPPYWGLRDYGIAPVEWEAVTFSPMAGLPTMTIPAMTAVHGLEPDIWSWVAHEVAIFRLVRALLADDGTCWVNLGDAYAAGGMGAGSGKQLTNRGTSVGGHMDKRRKAPDSLKPKDLLGLPWRVALALQADGWYLRQDVIWSKPNPMPESVRDRCTKAHEYLFMLAKSERYFFDFAAFQEPASWVVPLGATGVGFGHGTDRDERGRDRQKRDSFKREDSKRAEVIPGQTAGTHRPDRDESEWDTATRNRRSVWTVPTVPYNCAHFATFPPALIEPCIIAGSRPGDIVLDPFFGSGTTGQVAQRLGRQWIGCELNPAYAALHAGRVAQQGFVFHSED